MEKTITKKEKFVEATKNIPIIARKEGWVFTFDKEEGNLFYSPVKMPDNAELHQVTDEYAVYFDKNFKPRGLMIEYFQDNFLKHHKNFKKLSDEIFGSKEKIKGTNINKNYKEKAEILSSFIESNLIKEASTNLVAV
jgi:hypothetical protein